MDILTLLLLLTLSVLAIAIVYKYHQDLETIKEDLSSTESDLEKAHITVKELTGHINRQDTRLQTEIMRAEAVETQYQKLKESMDERFKSWQISAEKEIRKDSMDRSRRVMRGQATEHLAPYMIENFNPKDFRFMGDPIDYLIVVGGSDIRDGIKNEVEKIVLLDIKTGKAKLNKVQRRIRDAIKAGRISFMIFNPDLDEIKEYQFKNEDKS